MNICDGILKLATLNGLKTLATGGGLDYIIYKHPEGILAIRDVDDAGSPDNINSECYICLYTGWPYLEGRSAAKFDSVIEAINTIKNPEFHTAMSQLNNDTWPIILWD